MHEWLHYALHVSEVQIYEYVANLTKEAISISDAFIYFFFMLLRHWHYYPVSQTTTRGLKLSFYDF